MRLDELKPSTAKGIKKIATSDQRAKNINDKGALGSSNTSAIFTNNRKDRIIDYLDNNGYELIGYGHFSRVYGKHGSNFVVKVSSKPDPCYVKFAKYAEANPKNPHLPKVKILEFGDVSQRGDNTEFFVAYTEKLYELDMNVYEDVSRIWSAWAGARRNAAAHKRLDKKYSGDNSNSENPVTIMDMFPKKHLIQLREYKSLFSAINQMRKVVTKCKFDMHTENFMQRRDGTIVIIDPVSFELDTQGDRLGWRRK